MRRSDIRLLTEARRGDTAARDLVGRRYLTGGNGFPRNPQVGITYLRSTASGCLPGSLRLIAEILSLEELLVLQQEDALHAAAAAGSRNARFKLAVWLIMKSGDVRAGDRWLRLAAVSGHSSARRALELEGGRDHFLRFLTFLDTTSSECEIDVKKVLMIAAQRATASGNLSLLVLSVRAAMSLLPANDLGVADLLVAAVHLAYRTVQHLEGFAPHQVEVALQISSNRGDAKSSYILGCAYGGRDAGRLSAVSLVTRMNLRKSAALLLRAADCGNNDAWLQLYDLHADPKTSIGNAQMARFFIEKAACNGSAVAQRKLGALILRKASDVMETEAGIAWLSRASMAGDERAAPLLASLVLSPTGCERDARAAIEVLSGECPLLAARLELSRTFGLTKLEALTVDPVEGARPWGLVVGPNPFINQCRRSAPRAIPALSEATVLVQRRVTALFAQTSRDGQLVEGDLRRRSFVLRKALRYHQLDESLFFVRASSAALTSIRKGEKWAYRARRPLEDALGD